jgi:hypothetical protein
VGFRRWRPGFSCDGGLPMFRRLKLGNRSLCVVLRALVCASFRVQGLGFGV